MAKFHNGQRVSRNVDIYDEAKGLKFGTVFRCYSRAAYKIGDLHLGPYPELYSVKWDNGEIGKAYLPHGISAI